MRRTLRLLACSLAMMPVALCAQQAKPTNHEILNAALQDVIGSRQGTCKVYVQTVMARVGIMLGAGYRASYLAIGIEVSGNDALPGDIIQISNNANPEDAVTGYHTAIVQKNNGDGTFDVIDTNWSDPPDWSLRHHPNWNPYSWAASHGLSAHFYRLGRVDGASIGQSPNGAVNQKFVDMAQEIATAYRIPLSDITAYDNNGGGAYVHEWEHFGSIYTVQDVLVANAGLTHERALFILGHDGHTERVMVVKEGFYWLFMLHDTGIPIGNEELSGAGNGQVYQRFERAMAYWDNVNRVLILKDYNQTVIAQYTNPTFTIATAGDGAYTLNLPAPDPVIPITNLALVVMPAEVV